MAEASSSPANPLPDITLKVKWSSKVIPLALSPTLSIAGLKQCLYEETEVEPRRQRILGMWKGGKAGGKAAEDDDLLGDLNIKANATFIMMGSTEEKIASTLAPAEQEDVVDDMVEVPDEFDVAQHPDNLAKVAKRVGSLAIDVRHPPRAGKKLLVLDIDYTLYDHRSCAERMEELKRPFLDEFLAAAYEHYDIAIWSATSMKWIDAKLKELGVANHPAFRLSFRLDHTFMISVHTRDQGLVNVKPLPVIWAMFPGVYTPRNTIMIDDIRHNFLMNRRNGLRIRPCRHLPTRRGDDTELQELARYLAHIGTLSEDDFAALDHGKWRARLRPS